MKLDKSKVKKTPQDQISEVAKLNENIEAQINKIRKYTDIIIGDSNSEEIDDVLKGTDILINDCHIAKTFITVKSEKFSLLCYEYQKLSLKFESYKIKTELDNETKKFKIETKELNNQVALAKKSVKEIKNDTKSIVTTMVSIVLAISIIPTAIAGIQNINANYILPFISTVVLLGMIMIVFVYSIYQDKIKLITEIILILFMILTGILWVISWNWDIELQPRIIEKKTSITYSDLQ